MGLISLIVVLALIGVLVWAITTYIPMNDGFKRLITVMAIIVCVLWCLSLFGLLPVGPIHIR